MIAWFIIKGICYFAIIAILLLYPDDTYRECAILLLLLFCYYTVISTSRACAILLLLLFCHYCNTFIEHAILLLLRFCYFIAK